MNIETAEKVYELMRYRKLITESMKHSGQKEFFIDVLTRMDNQIKQIEC
jgi:hypothetical protein